MLQQVTAHCKAAIRSMAFDSAGVSDAVAKVSLLVVGTTLYFYISSGNCCLALLMAHST